MEEATSTTVHNQPKRNNKRMVKINRPLGGGGGGGIGVGILILGGAVAAAAFLFNQRRRNKKGSSQPAKVVQDKYINEDKGLQYVAATSSANSDSDQDQHPQMRNETSSNGMHDQKQNGSTMVSDETSFAKQDEKSKGKLEVNGKNEDLLSNSPQLMDHILKVDPPSREREFQTAIPDEGKTLLQPTIPESDLAMQEIAIVQQANVNGQDMQVSIRGEEIKVKSWESNEGSKSNGDLLPPISEIEEEVSFQPMADNISMSNGCKENAQEIQAADVGNNEEDEEINAAIEEPGKGEEETACTKSSAGNEANEEHQTDFRYNSNGIKSEVLEVTDKFQVPEEEENLNHLLISETLEVAEEVIARGEAGGKEETEMSGEQIHETREKAKPHHVDHQEPQMDTMETTLKGFQDDESPTSEPSSTENNVNVPDFDADNEFKERQPAEIAGQEKENVDGELGEEGLESKVVEIADEPTSTENNVNVPEFDADNEFKQIHQPAEIARLEKENVDGELREGLESKVVEIADETIQLNDEDRRTLKEAEDKVTTEEQRLTRLEEDENNDMDESSTSDKVEQSSEGTTDSSAESNGDSICPAESIPCQPIELEKTEANDSKEIVELPNEEENGENHDDISTIEMRLQNRNDEKGNSKLTVLEKYMVQLGELALEATHPQKRRMLALTIMASSSSLCLYFGMDFLKICLIFILSMMLFEMQGL